jgi:hypothetical protein
MKQKLVMTIIVAAFFSAIISFMIAKFTFGSVKNREHQVDVVPPISALFLPTNPQDFNSNSIDPTQLIRIGVNNNQTPFNSSTQQ